MLKYILKRLLLLIPTVWGVVTLVFIMMALAPGDPAQVMLGERASKKSLENLRQELGLNQPLHVRYWKYLKRTSQLDFGKSIKSGQKVIDEIKAHFPATIEMSLVAMFFATLIGIIAGVLSASKQYSFIDYSSMFMALVGVSMPIFWLGLVLIIIFSINLNLLPTGGRIGSRMFFEPITNFYLIDSVIYIFKTGNFAYFWSTIKHLLLPSITLSTIPVAIIARMTRSSMLEVLKQDYIRTARAKGLKENVVIYKHALKNAMLPVITIIGLQFGLLLGGAVLTETIFSWPGLGKWLYNAIEARDFPSVQGGIIIISTTFLFINLIVDILYSYLNPKIKY